MVENNIRERVRDALSKIVDNNKYVINVDVDLEISDEVEEQITVLAERGNQKVQINLMKLLRQKSPFLAFNNP